MKYSTNNLAATALIFLLTLFKQVKCDYIRSDLLTISEDMDVASELINLNKLMSHHKKTTVDNYLFKLVNDSLLCNYVELKHLELEEGQQTLILLKKQIQLNELQCAKNSCEQTLKIIAVNQNDFIEIPIKITKRSWSNGANKKLKQQKNKPTSLNFKQETIYMNLTNIKNQFKLEPPEIQNNNNNNNNKDSLSNLIKYKIVQEDEDNDNYFNVNLNDLNLSIDFKNKMMFDKAFNLNKKFNLKLIAFLSSSDFDVKKNATQNIFFKVSIQPNKNTNDDEMKPLDFDKSIYSVIITDLNRQIVLEPKLKNPYRNGDILFSLYDEENSESTIQNANDFPFQIDESNGQISLKDEFHHPSKNIIDKFYSFGIKATYKKLIDKNANKEKYYNYDYMLSAFAKIQIKFQPTFLSSNTKNDNSIIIKSEIVTTFITKYEIINEYSSNQTYIMYINDPIGINNKLIKLFYEKSDENLNWILNDENVFKYDIKNRDSIILSNKIEFKDQNVYKTSIKVENGHKQIKSEIKLEFHIDFDPLLFEKNEYNLHLSQSNLLNQELIKFNIKERLNFNNTILYRLTSNNNDDEYFEINSSNGILQARKILTQKYFYELNVIGMSAELQKTAMAKLKVQIDCFKKESQSDNSQNNNRKVKFSIFENSPNRTQIGILKSVCSNSNYNYEIEQKNDVILKVCSEKNCTKFDLNLSKLNNFNPQENKLFDLDTKNGLLMTNYMLNSNLLLSLIKNQQQKEKLDSLLADYSNIYEKYELNILFRSKLTNSLDQMELNYEIEIKMQDSPKIINFNENLIYEVTSNNLEENVTENQSQLCLYSYKFSSSNNNNIQRFVRVDANSAHSEAEFKTQDCYASFFIHNNGCLILKYDHLNKTSQCHLAHTQNRVLIKSGLYMLEFKLCYYDNNKVSCSQMYQQSIHLKNDLSKNSKLKIKHIQDVEESELREITTTANLILTTTELSEQKQSLLSSLLNPTNLQSRHHHVSTNSSTSVSSSTKTNMIFFNDANKSYYLLVLVVIILIVALLVILAFTFLFIIYARPSNRKGKSETAKTKNEVLVVTTSPSSSNKSSILNTPETASSNAPSSTKTMHEDHDDVNKIQVSDDFNKHKQSISNNNVNYASSFTSLSSTSNHSNSNEKQIIKVIDQINTNNQFDSGSSSYFGGGLGASMNDQGLYSVKTASIKFQNRASNSLLMKTYDNVINNLIIADSSNSSNSTSSMSNYNNSLKILSKNNNNNNNNNSYQYTNFNTNLTDENNLYKKYETNTINRANIKTSDVIASVV